MFWQDHITRESGPYDVRVKRGEFVDVARDNRSVPFKIYHPETAGAEKVPVILWSHGFGGNRDGASFLSRYLSSYGYALVHLTHPGTDSALWEGKPGHPWDILRETPIKRRDSLNRFRDVPFALDQLHGWEEENFGIHESMDFSMIGMSGHSFGAMTTQAMAGQMFPDEEEKLIRMRDDRFKAGILYSPVPIGHLTNEQPESLYGPIAMPLLHMTGTKDDSPLEGFGYEHRKVIYDHTGHPEKYLLVKNDGDHMVYNGTRGKLDPNPKREKHEELVRVISLAFWDAYLKNDQKAKAWLAGEGLQAYIAAEAEFEVHGS